MTETNKVTLPEKVAPEHEDETSITVTVVVTVSVVFFLAVVLGALLGMVL